MYALLPYLAVLAFGLIFGYILAKKGLNNSSGQHHQEKRCDQVVKIQVKAEGGKQGWFLDLPENLFKRLRDLCRAAIIDQDLTGARWAGKGKLFSRGEWEGLITEMLKRDWLYWINPDAHNRGLRLTAAGRAAFRFLASDAGSPTPHHQSIIKGFDLAYTYRPTHTDLPAAPTQVTMIAGRPAPAQPAMMRRIK